MDEKPNKYEHLPIPTYEEATSSRPPSSQSRTGPEEVSNDAERQGLLGRNARSATAPRHGRYEPPSVESARPSVDTLDGIDAESDDGEVRRQMQEMEMEDPDSDNGSHRSLLTYRFKRLTSFTNSFSSLQLPSFQRWVPSIPWPNIDWEAVNTHRVVILGRLFGVALIMGVVYVLVASNVFTMTRRMRGQLYDPETIKSVLQGGFGDPSHIGRHLHHLTQYPHLAGTEGNYVLGEYIAEKFKEANLEDVYMERFDVYLNYPRDDGRRVAIVEPEDQKWEAKIEEDDEQVVVFHGHSKAGDVTGPLIYANYGSREDFHALEKKGISVKGTIALVRYGGTEPDRGLKVKAAELAGAVGCIIYSDPAQNGLGKGATYPEGRYMPADGVQRGSVSLMSYVLGDVLTPGWASTPAEKQRLNPEESEGLNKIPSIPLSWRDAQHLLGSLKGHGEKLDGDWVGVPDVEYWSGDRNSPKVNLKNQQDEVIRQPIYNVVGRITGWEQPEKKIVLGNHRDAWCLGAGDPGSGTAVLLHLVAIFGEMVADGWRPLRTIEFASWDAEEYNMVGSTEHVENRLDEYRRNGIAYLNCDVAVTGTDMEFSSSPVFNEPVREALNRIANPSGNGTLLEVWDQKYGRPAALGGGSDYMAFQDVVGMSSIDIGFTGPPDTYHSCYDNFDWMDRFGDPGWQYSAAIGQLWGLLALEFADTPLMPFDIKGYASTLSAYLDELEADTRKHLKQDDTPGEDVMIAAGRQLNFRPLRSAIKTLDERAHEISKWDEVWYNVVYNKGGYESSQTTTRRIDRNSRVANFDAHLLDLSEGGGLVNRTQYKHVIFAPATWKGYDAYVFPSIRQWLDIEDWDKMQTELIKVAHMIEAATFQLTP